MPGKERENRAGLTGLLSCARRYEQAWRSGSPPELTEWVRAHPASSAEELAELVRTDLRLRFGKADAWSLEQYFAAFPSLLDRPQLAAAVMHTELVLRQSAGEPASTTDYLRRFPAAAAALAQLQEAASAMTASSADALPGESQDTISFVQQPSSTRAALRGDLKLDAEATPSGRPQIAGYEILGFVAKGGMGVVYKARDKVLGRTVALKLPRPGYVESEQDKDRFLREARAAARLRHANICPLFEVRETDDGRPYICMAFVEGETLKTWVTRQHPGPRQLAELVATLSRAVQYAHEQGVVHRDLKPSNVMVEAASGQPMLMDFGLAKDLSQEDGLTISGDVMGTPAYMAPEQAAGKTHELGPAVDTYSLGAILYELIAGQPPFRGSAVEVLLQVQNDEPESLRRRMPGVHLDLETICLKAMAKRAQDRYVTAGALAEDLDRFARGEAILARRQSAMQRSWRLVRKYPIAMGLGATAAIALLLLLALTPALSSSWELSRMTARLEAELSRPDWSPQGLTELDALVGEIAAIAPQQAADHRQRVTSRLDAYVATYLDPDRGRWSPEDWLAIEAAVEQLAARDSAAALRRQADADRLRGLPERVADMRPPWQNYQDILPGLTRDEQRGVLRLPPLTARPGAVLSLASQESDGEFHIEAELDLPANAVAGLALNVRQVHTGGITALAIHPTNAVFASASTDGDSIRLWDAALGVELKSLPGHSQGIRSLDFSPDGKWLVSIGFDERAKVWDLTTHKLAHTLAFTYRNFQRGASVLTGPPGKFSRDGTRLFIGCADGNPGGEIRVWSVPDFKPLPALPTSSSPLVCLELPAAGETLFAGTIDGHVYVWDTAAGKLLRDFSVPVPNLTSLAIDAPGKRIAAANAVGLVHVCDEHGMPQFSLQGFAAGVYALAFHPRGEVQTLAAGYEDGHVKFWDLATQQVQRTSPLVGRRCNVLAYAPGGDWGLTGNELGLIQRLDMASGNEHYRLGSQQYEFRVSRSADGHTVQLESRRNTSLLRAVEQAVPPGPLKLSVRRNEELLGMQVNANPEMIFRDYFPPVTMDGGRWGVLLSSESALQRLLARRRRKAVTGSPLEQGHAMLRRNELSEALDFFDQQNVVAGGDAAADVRQEAQFMAAMCLVRLNRLEEAEERLQALAASPRSRSSAGLVAKFQIWLLRLQQQRLDDANSLFNTIRSTESADDIAAVVAADTRQQILRYYNNSVVKRKLLLQPGMLPRLEAALAVQEFFQVSDDESRYLRWQHVEALRLLENHGEARLAEERLVLDLQSRLRLPASPAEVGEESLEEWAQFSLACRMIDQPERAEMLYDTQLLDASRNLRPEVKGPALGLLLERARLHAHRQQWSEALRCLDQLLNHATSDQVPRRLLIKSHLLRGFLLRRLDKQGEALQAWQAGCDQLNLQAADFAERAQGEAGWEQFVDMLLLGTLAERLDDAALKEALGQILKIAGSLAGISEALPAVLTLPAILSQAWRSPQGQIVGERIARGELMPGEQIAGFMKLLMAELLRQGAFGGQLSAEQDQIVWRFCQEALRAHFLGEMHFPAVAQVALVWKGGPNFLGWPATIAALPSSIQPEMAYLLAHRSLRRGRQADARQLLELATKLSADDSAVHVLAKSESAASGPGE